MRFDEVYQAALAASSGGIRWNSETNKIQLADENKNWVDWRYYNPNRTLSVVSWAESSGYNYTVENPGTYILAASSYSEQVINASVNSIKYVYERNGGSSGYNKVAVITANNGDTISGYFSAMTYSPNCAIFYICSEFVTDSNLITAKGAINTTLSLTVPETVQNRILLGQLCGQNRSVSLSASNNEYVTDGATNKTYACISMVNNPGSGSITVIGSGGASACIVDIQLVF